MPFPPLPPPYPVELLKKLNLWGFVSPEILFSSTIQTIKSRQLCGKFKKLKKKKNLSCVFTSKSLYLLYLPLLKNYYTVQTV